MPCIYFIICEIALCFAYIFKFITYFNICFKIKLIYFNKMNINGLILVHIQNLGNLNFL